MRFYASIVAFLAALLLVSCGEDGRHFKIEGRLLQMNQGEFYVYSPEGDIQGIDTIKVQGGRFAYEAPCERQATLVLVFPNFSEVPIFAEPGKTVSVKGDASHLKMLEIKGTKDNELMSSFRSMIANASPPEIKKYAAQFIADHPESVVGTWLLRKYFIAVQEPDYTEAARLAKLMMAKQKDNGGLIRLSNDIASLEGAAVGKTLPVFTAYDINGKLVSSSDLSTGTAVICTWASWNYSSTDILRQLRNKVNASHGVVKVVTISLDASRTDCRNSMQMNDLSYPVICTEEMFETALLSKLAMRTVPDNIVVKNGKIVARDLSAEQLVRNID